MNPHDDSERDLRALFDATVAPPDKAALDRMARKAAQVPEHTKASWWSFLLAPERRKHVIGLLLAGAVATTVALVQFGGILDDAPVATPLQPVGDNEPLLAELDYDDIDEDNPLAADDADPLGGFSLEAGASFGIIDVLHLGELDDDVDEQLNTYEEVLDG